MCVNNVDLGTVDQLTAAYTTDWLLWPAEHSLPVCDVVVPGDPVFFSSVPLRECCVYNGTLDISDPKRLWLCWWCAVVVLLLCCGCFMVVLWLCCGCDVVVLWLCWWFYRLKKAKDLLNWEVYIRNTVFLNVCKTCVTLLCLCISLKTNDLMHRHAHAYIECVSYQPNDANGETWYLKSPNTVKW